MDAEPRVLDRTGRERPRYVTQRTADGSYSTWTPERVEQVRALAFAGKSATQAGEIMGCSSDALISLGKRNGFRFESQTQWTMDRISRLRALVKDGVATNEIADEIGATRGSVRHWAAKNGVALNNSRHAPVKRKPARLPVAFTAPPQGGITIVDITPWTCRWPFGDPSDLSSFAYCGASVRELGESYCECHHKLAYVRPRYWGASA